MVPHSLSLAGHEFLLWRFLYLRRSWTIWQRCLLNLCLFSSEQGAPKGYRLACPLDDLFIRHLSNLPRSPWQSHYSSRHDVFGIIDRLPRDPLHSWQLWIQVVLENRMGNWHPRSFTSLLINFARYVGNWSLSYRIRLKSFNYFVLFDNKWSMFRKEQAKICCRCAGGLGFWLDFNCFSLPKWLTLESYNVHHFRTLCCLLNIGWAFPTRISHVFTQKSTRKSLSYFQ